MNVFYQSFNDRVATFLEISKLRVKSGNEKVPGKSPGKNIFLSNVREKLKQHFILLEVVFRFVRFPGACCAFSFLLKISSVGIINF